MEYAQLARNLAADRGFTTQCVRPADLWYLSRSGRAVYGAENFPDIRHAPLYPYLLSLGFRVVHPSFTMARGAALFKPEVQVILPFGLLFSLRAGLFVLLAAARLFDRRVASAATAVFFLTETVLAGALSGTPLSLRMLLAAAGVYAAVVAVGNRSADSHPLRWITPAVLSAFLCGLAALSGYAAGLALVVVLGLFMATGLGRGGRLAALGLVLVAAAMLTPWLVRNRQASGGVLGVAPYETLSGTYVSKGGSFDRSLEHDVRSAPVLRALRYKFVDNVARQWERNLLRTVGGGLLIAALFVASFFCRFDRDEAGRLRWCLLAGLGVLLAAAAVGFGEAAESLPMFLPLVVVLGTAMFFSMMELYGFSRLGWEAFLTWALVAVNALPVILAVTARRADLPYPPYYPPFVSYVCGMLEPREAICTDIPWATAWYGNRFSVLLPQTVGDFMTLHRSRFPMSGLYLTTETTDRPYVTGLQKGSEREWLPIVNRAVPPDFPFRQGVALPPGSNEQLFLTDRVRWK